MILDGLNFSLRAPRKPAVLGLKRYLLDVFDQVELYGLRGGGRQNGQDPGIEIQQLLVLVDPFGADRPHDLPAALDRDT